MRFLRAASDEAYEGFRLSLDATWGLPDGRGTDTCITPAADAPRDDRGRIVLAVPDAFWKSPGVAALLPSLLSEKSVDDISVAGYVAVLEAYESPRGQDSLAK